MAGLLTLARGPLGPAGNQPGTLGRADYPPREPAPGTYVFDR